MNDNVQYVLYMKIIFQDELIVIADKPPGIESEDFVKQCEVPLDRGGMVHRLDKDTSGLFVIAKTQDILDNLQQQFREHQVKKVYATLVYGKMESGWGSIESRIARDPKRKQAMKVIPFTTGGERGKLRQSISEWRVIDEFKFRMTKFESQINNKTRISKNQKIRHSNFDIDSSFVIQNSSLKPIVVGLLEVTIKTGRTHQIRVHMQSIGHPVLGDKMYNTKESQKVSKLIGLNRQFLHATELGFRHPKTGKWVKFTSRLPDDLQETLNKLT